MNAMIVSRAGDKNCIPNTVSESVSYFRKIERDSSAWGYGGHRITRKNTEVRLGV